MTRDIYDKLIQKFGDKNIFFLENSSPCGQDSILLTNSIATQVALYLRDELGFDYCSNVTGVDWLEGVKKGIWKSENQSEQISISSGFLEAVYHLYSTTQRIGPFVIRLRTNSREKPASLPSLTPIWKSAEFQEREIFDLFGIRFEGHPDLRRLLMWDEFEDYPMRKDFVPPDDYDYEPTPHGQVLERVKQRQNQAD